MFIFKTSGETFLSVIKNKKHAFRFEPSDWNKGEIALISKNKVDCQNREHQIRYIAEIDKIRPPQKGEIEELWPGHQGQWDYIVEFSRVVKLLKSFNLDQVIPDTAHHYAPVMTYSKFSHDDEVQIFERIKDEL